MTNEETSYEELQARLRHAEAILDSLRRGEVDMVVGSGEPIVVRFRSVVEEKERLRSMVEALAETAPTLIVVVDDHGRIVHFNRACEEVSGCSRTEVMGKTISELSLPPRWSQAVAEHLAGPLAGSLKEPHVIPWITRSGQERLIEWRCVTVTSPPPAGGNLLMGIGLDVTERERAQQELLKSHARLERVLQGTLDVIEQATEARDPYTAGHQRRVAELAVAIARQMGLPEESCVTPIRTAALVHDVGKIAIPTDILSKPARLSRVEFELVKAHPQVGYDILKRADLPEPVPEIVLQHHERLDGSGYPQGLSGDDILPEAQILAVADVTEAMSSHRPYRAALGVGAALEELSAGSGTRYHPDVVAACRAVFRDGFSFPA